METAAFEKGSSHASKVLRKTQRQFQDMGNKISGIGKTLSIGLTAPLAALAVTSSKAATESAQAMGQVQSALNSMGNASGRTAEQLGKSATALMKMSTVDDDDILRKVTSNLLTFGAVSGKVFDDAQKVIVDYSARTGTDLQSATIMIGKALQDPIKGVAALQKVGIKLDETQKANIASMMAMGNTAGAQGIILGELNKQYEGSAKALRDATPGVESQQAWADFQETLGGIVNKVLQPLTSMLTKVLDTFNGLTPGQQKFAVGAAALGAALGPVMMVMGPLVKVMGTMLPLLVKLAPAVSMLGKALLFIAANPVILGLAAVVGGIYLAWKNWDKIQPIVQRMVSGVTSWLKALASPFNWVIDKLKVVGNAFFTLYDKVVGHSYIPDMVEGIRIELAKLEAVLVKPVLAATSKAEQAFRDFAAKSKALLDELFPESVASREFSEKLDTIGRSGWSDAVKREARRRLAANDMAAGNVTPIEQGAKKAAEGALPELAEAAEATTVRVAKSFEDMVRNVSSSIKGFVDAIKGGGILDILTSALDVFMTLGSAGLFGSGIKTNLNKSYANRANGGPVFAGRTYMVGERGKEFFTPSQSGYIKPNNDRGGRVVHNHFSGNLMTPEFWGIINKGDQMAMMGGAAGGQAGVYRRAMRTLP